VTPLLPTDSLVGGDHSNWSRHVQQEGPTECRERVGIGDHHGGVVVRVKSVVVKSEMTAGAVCRCSSAALMVLQQRVGT
jgi:hypothetical protein